jgi:SAM-dependent methyltransferase
MAKQPNDAEIANWNGPIGERWVAHQEMLDARLQVFSPHLLAAAELTHGQRILDIGCGCGAISLEVARAVGPTGHVVGLDVSRPMLARARDRAKDHPNIELVEHDDSILKGAGWSAIELTPRSQPFGLGDTLDDAVDYATSMGPSGRALRTSEDDATRERAREMLRQTLAPFGPSFALQSAVWLVTARA